MRDRLIYGSYDASLRQIVDDDEGNPVMVVSGWQVSLDPPDSPVRRVVDVDREEDVAALAKRRRARVFWWPPRKVLK